MALERILFGDNQFFGVNHMSEDKAQAQSIRFRDTDAIIDVLKIAYDEGIRVFMCTTHERIAEVCEYFRAHQDRYAALYLGASALYNLLPHFTAQSTRFPGGAEQEDSVYSAGNHVLDQSVERRQVQHRFHLLGWGKRRG